MSDTLIICPKCGGVLAGSQVLGLCVRCLGAMNFATETPAGEAGQIPHAPPPDVEELAPFFPHLEVLSYLGRGGMGVVYKARQRSLHRAVALKLLAPERAGDPIFAQRFAREARSMAALNHPHIVGVHDFGQAGGYFYLLMEFVDGVNLRQLMQSRQLTPQEALSIVGPVCDALQSAHERGIVHRDVKPENLLIDRSGIVKIADFGISRMMDETGENSSMVLSGDHATGPTLDAGTPDYAAPEQLASSSKGDHRSDIYSLGVVLYEMLTGERPGKDFSTTGSSRKVSGDVRIDGIVLKAMEEAPGRRFHTVAEFRAQVTQAQQALEMRARPAPRRLRWILAVILLIAISSGAAFFLPPLLHSNRQTKAGASSPTVAGPQTLAPEEALQQFNENFTALMEARKSRLLDTGDDPSAKVSFDREVSRLEAKDAELRKTIERLSTSR